MRDPHIKARNMVVEIEHPKIGHLKTIGLPIKSTGELTAIRKPAPWLGQHSAEVLRGIGYGRAEIDALFAGGVVYDKVRGRRRRRERVPIIAVALCKSLTRGNYFTLF